MRRREEEGGFKLFHIALGGKFVDSAVRRAIYVGDTPACGSGETRRERGVLRRRGYHESDRLGLGLCARNLSVQHKEQLCFCKRLRQPLSGAMGRLRHERRPEPCDNAGGGLFLASSALRRCEKAKGASRISRSLVGIEACASRAYQLSRARLVPTRTRIDGGDP